MSRGPTKTRKKRRLGEKQVFTKPAWIAAGGDAKLCSLNRERRLSFTVAHDWLCVLSRAYLYVRESRARYS